MTPVQCIMYFCIARSAGETGQSRGFDDEYRTPLHDTIVQLGGKRSGKYMYIGSLGDM